MKITFLISESVGFTIPTSKAQLENYIAQTELAGIPEGGISSFEVIKYLLGQKKSYNEIQYALTTLKPFISKGYINGADSSNKPRPILYYICSLERFNRFIKGIKPEEQSVNVVKLFPFIPKKDLIDILIRSGINFYSNTQRTIVTTKSEFLKTVQDELTQLNNTYKTIKSIKK